MEGKRVKKRFCNNLTCTVCGLIEITLQSFIKIYLAVFKCTIKGHTESCISIQFIGEYLDKITSDL